MTRSGRFFASSDRPVAAVYRGPIASEGCAESVAKLLRSSPLKYKVHYLGPNEEHDVCAELLSHVDMFAWPGGGDDVDEDYEKVKRYTESIQRYVDGGGRYLGVCLGAFLARGEDSSFFGLLPAGSYVACERFEPNAQERDDDDTIVEVDWTWQEERQGEQTANKRWMYFQDGATIKLDQNVERQSVIVARYSSTQNICSSITPYGKGFVGLIGTHPEADKSWYDDEDLVNPQGVSFAYGHDLIYALHHAKQR